MDETALKNNLLLLGRSRSIVEKTDFRVTRLDERLTIVDEMLAEEGLVRAEKKWYIIRHDNTYRLIFSWLVGVRIGSFSSGILIKK